jgi:hypothetical protein
VKDPARIVRATRKHGISAKRAYKEMWDRLEASRRVLECKVCGKVELFRGPEDAELRGWQPAWAPKGATLPRVWTCKHCKVEA